MSFLGNVLLLRTQLFNIYDPSDRLNKNQINTFRILYKDARTKEMPEDILRPWPLSLSDTGFRSHNQKYHLSLPTPHLGNHIPSSRVSSVLM